MSERTDLVVIMARGASRRMGQAKGLLSNPATDEVPFVAAIAARYTRLGLTGVVITTPDLVESHAEALLNIPAFAVVGAPAGGDTALTLWQAWETTGRHATHLWAHPVDLPLVAETSLRQLLAHTSRHPARLVRPVWQQRPGHPVIMPASVLTAMQQREDWRTAPMREVIARACQLAHIDEPTLLPVTDPGVVTDFDHPADLDRT